MFRETSRAAALLSAVLSAVFLAGHAGATTLSLTTGKSVQMQPSGSGTFTFSMTNDTGAITDNFLAWTLGVQVVPAGITSGSLTLGALAQPAVNPMPTGTLDLTQPLLSTLALSGTINGSTQYYLTNATATEVIGTVDSGGSYNLGNLTLSASPTASGTWNVYAVQQGGSFYKSYWTDGTQTDVAFENLPIGATSASVNNTSLLLGTVTVTAVPEPGSMVVVATAFASAGWYAWRTRRKPALEVVEG